MLIVSNQQISKQQQSYYQQKMSLDISDLGQVYQRSDMHLLASQGERNNFNIRRFKQKSSLKDKRKSLHTKYTDTSTKYRDRVNTQPVEDRGKQIKSSMSYTNAFERIMNKNQPDHQKRMTFVGSLKFSTIVKKQQTNSQLSNSNQKDKLNVRVEQVPDIEAQKAQKFRHMAKKVHKGPVSKKIVQTWLNSILMQSTQFEVLDETLGNAALKKFEIDENSLLSRAIKPQNVSRIYQTLFVHSIGFNNNIKQLVSGNTEVLKNIWKVFSILLQYCAQGKFQTLIGTLERQKAIKIEELRQEVAKRQQIIQRNDELNENKNIQIFKQIKNLKQENINLTNQKDILYEDYQKTQQAFNEEVALRLKFQNKINQLFGVHRQLAVKHQRLYDDYKRKVIQWNVANQKNSQLTQQNGQLKIQLNDLTSEKQRFISSQKYNKQLLIALKEEKVKLNDEYNMVKHQYDEERRITKESKRRVTQLQIEVKNLSEIVGIKDKSWKETHAEYQLSLEENNRLYLVINQQRIQVQSLLFEKKQFNNKILNIMADASFEKKKKQEFSKLYYDTDRKLNEKIQKIRDLQLQISIASRKNQSAQEDLKVNYENIKQMHFKNNELEEEVTFLRRFRDNLDSVIEEKQNLAEKFKSENEKLLTQNEELKTSLNKLQMNFKMTKAELGTQITTLSNGIEKMKEQKQLIQLGDNEKNRIILANKLEIQRLTKLLQNTVLDLKNEKFERFNLKTNYQQSLNIIEKKNSQEKQMGRLISELKDQVLIISQQRDRINLALENEIKRRERLEEQIEEHKIQFAEYKEAKSAHIHPFIFEDVAENFRKMKEKLQYAQMVIRMKIQQIKQIRQKHQNQLASLKKSSQDYFQSFKRQKEKQVFQKQTQLQYEKQLSASMKSRLEKLESLAQTYAKKIDERTNAEKQRIYSQMIEQKTKSIEDLMKKLGIETKKNEELKQEIIKDNQIHAKQMIEAERKHRQEKSLQEEKINDLNFQIQHIQKQSEILLKQIKQHEAQLQQKVKQRMQAFLENYKKMSISQTVSQGQNEQQLQPKQQFNQSSANWNLLNDIEKKNPEIKKRNEMSRKMKIAYHYYNHK